jgi:hypothetical protein
MKPGMAAPSKCQAALSDISECVAFAMRGGCIGGFAQGAEGEAN